MKIKEHKIMIVDEPEEIGLNIYATNNAIPERMEGYKHLYNVEYYGNGRLGTFNALLISAGEYCFFKGVNRYDKGAIYKIKQSRIISMVPTDIYEVD